MAWATRLKDCASARRRLARPLRGDFGQSGFAGSLRCQALAQRRLLAQQAGMGPHGGLQAGNELFHALGFLCGEALWGGSGVRRNRAGASGSAVGQHGLRGARAEDEPFEQGIGGQAVGAVHAGAGGFAGSVEAAEAGAPAQIGADAAHEVMRRGANGDEVAARGRGRIAPEMR